VAVTPAVRGDGQAVFDRAMHQETRIAFQRGQACPYFRCPYHAKVMKTFEKIKQYGRRHEVLPLFTSTVICERHSKELRRPR